MVGRPLPVWSRERERRSSKVATAQWGGQAFACLAKKKERKKRRRKSKVATAQWSASLLCLPGLLEGHVWKNRPRKTNWVKWPRDVELGQKDQENERGKYTIIGD